MVVAQVAVVAVAGHLPAVQAVGAEGRVGGRDRGEPDGAEDVGDRVARAGVDQVRVERHEADDGDLHGRGLRGLVHVGDRLVRHDRQVDRVVFDDEGHGDVLPGDLDLAVGGDVDVDGQAVVLQLEVLDRLGEAHLDRGAGQVDRQAVGRRVVVGAGGEVVAVHLLPLSSSEFRLGGELLHTHP